jgi:hypothetical protein
MSYAEKIKVWERSAPAVKIQIGRYTLTFSYENSYESNWEWCWICVESVMYELDWEGTPESSYFNKITEGMESCFYDKEYMDEMLEAINTNPFTTQD